MREQITKTIQILLKSLNLSIKECVSNRVKYNQILDRWIFITQMFLNYQKFIIQEINNFKINKNPYLF